MRINLIPGQTAKMLSLLTLSAGLVWAQGAQSPSGFTRARLLGIDDPDTVASSQVATGLAVNSGSTVTAAPQLSFTFTTFPFPGANRTFAFGINNQGQIAGGYRILPAPRHAALIENGQFVPLDPSGVLGSHLSTAFDINERGDVVGSYRDDQGVQHGFLLSNNVLTNIDFPGATLTDALGINASGVIVGDFLDSARVLHGFVLRDGVYTQIDVPGAVDTQPVEINASGDIVGGWDINDGAAGHGFLLTREGQFITIDVPKAPPESTDALGINDRGQIVGGYNDAAGNLHCFLLIAGTFTDVDFPGAPFTQCGGINNAESIAGTFFTGTGQSGAYVATPSQR